MPTPPAIGEKMTDAELLDFTGKKCNLSDFNNKKILIEFWSMTCLTCMRTAPEISNANQEFGDSIHFIGINCDTTKSMWETGTNRDSITWTNLSDLKGVDGVAGAYGVAAFPVFYLIDENGIVLDKWMGYKAGRIKEKIESVV